MIITTKFEVGSLIQMRYDRNTEDMFQLLEVKEVFTQVCYGGTQVFYDCRTIIAKKEYKGFKREGDFEWVVGHSISKEDKQTGWKRYREDELIDGEKKLIEIINTKPQ